MLSHLGLSGGSGNFSEDGIPGAADLGDCPALERPWSVVSCTGWVVKLISVKMESLGQQISVIAQRWNGLGVLWGPVRGFGEQKLS